jgi:3-dehydroquinate synthase
VSNIRVEAASASYTVHVGQNLLPGLAAKSLALAGKISRVFLVTSPAIDGLWSAPIREGFASLSIPLETLLIPAGEQHKRIATIERLLEEMAGHGADRDSLIVALGGGVIGDMAGFLASIYMRGINFVQVPTTLLAQVDSSVGGKTGANLKAGKNLVGAFYHPLAVFADLDTLTSLPPRELRAGLQESVKAGVIRDPALFAAMEANAEAILAGDLAAIEPVVEASVQMKADVVAADEREGGVRMILNFGHTVGHAIEAATHYKGMLHGEAIGWGMIAAVRLGQARGTLSDQDAKRIVDLVHTYSELPRFNVTAERLVMLTGSDKKKRSGTLSFIVPTAIGTVEIVRDVTDTELHEAVEEMLVEMRARPIPVLVTA